MRDAALASRPLFVRLLSTQNPFYVISAVLVLYGLRQCTLGSLDLTGGWILMGVICAYTLLLAIAVAVIIRLARMWDDARMILLVLVLLFLALSVSFDKIVLSQPWVGSQFLLVGFAFSVLISEFLLAVLRMRLPLAFRVPYYLLLALLFGYPLLTAELSFQGWNEQLAWAVYLFPWLAGGLFLTLLPAARGGRRLTRENGTPWKWPLYPWTLFAFLWICIVLRTYSLTFAFEAPNGLHAYFQPHFLTPLILSASAVLLELGIAGRSGVTKASALLLPVFALPLCVISTSGGFHGLPETTFLNTLSDTVASPVQITAALAVLFYVIAWARGLRRAEIGVVGMLFVLSVLTSQTWSFRDVALPQAGPWELGVLALLFAGVMQRRHWKTYIGAAMALATIALRHWDVAGPAIVVHRGFYSLHAALLAMTVFAILGESKFALRLREKSMYWLPALAVIAGAMNDELYPMVDARITALYLVGLTLASWMMWQPERPRASLISAGIVVLANALPGSKQLYWILHGTVLGRGLAWITLGFALLLVAVIVSFWRGGLLTPLWQRLARLQRAPQPPDAP